MMEEVEKTCSKKTSKGMRLCAFTIASAGTERPLWIHYSVASKGGRAKVLED